jgi:hypothetical protein
MKSSYRIWLNTYTHIPYGRSGKLIGEPYKGFIFDINELDLIEKRGYSCEGDHQKYIDIENKIQYNTLLWKSGVRW